MEHRGQRARVDQRDTAADGRRPLRVSLGRSATRIPGKRGNALRLPLRTFGSLAELSVWAGGRRIDAGAQQRRVLAETSIAEPEIAQAATDPAAPGPYRAQRLRYRLPSLALEGYPVPVEVVAEVTAPIGKSGEMPLVLFLHGRHSTCYRGGPSGESSGDWPCPTGWRPVPSHTGYRYITDVLATQGYLTVSISANGINGQDGLFIDGGASARSQLVRHHLALWSDWSSVGGDPWGGRFLGRVDMDRGRARRSQPRRRGSRARRDRHRCRRPVADPGPGADRSHGVRSPGRRRHSHHGHPAILRRGRDQSRRSAVRGHRAGSDDHGPRPALIGDGDGDQPQLLQHRVDTGAVAITGVGRLVRSRRSAMRRESQHAPDPRRTAGGGTRLHGSPGRSCDRGRHRVAAVARRNTREAAVDRQGAYPRARYPRGQARGVQGWGRNRRDCALAHRDRVSRLLPGRAIRSARGLHTRAALRSPSPLDSNVLCRDRACAEGAQGGLAAGRAVRCRSRSPAI